MFVREALASARQVLQSGTFRELKALSDVGLRQLCEATWEAMLNHSCGEVRGSSSRGRSCSCGCGGCLGLRMGDVLGLQHSTTPKRDERGQDGFTHQ